MLSEFFQLGPLPKDQMIGSYNMSIVLLSYIVAVGASYCALDIAGRLRDLSTSLRASILWLVGGSFAMGAGIWSMHFIGMLAYTMPMTFNPYWTLLSLVVAILASCFALLLLKNKTDHYIHLFLGGIILGLAIATMHYLGMEAMKVEMNIRYIPSLFILSIIVAIIASEAALWLAIRSNRGALKSRIQLKIMSSLVMGAAICGMHYIGMEASVFTPNEPTFNNHPILIEPQILSAIVALVSFIILGVTFSFANYKEILNDRTASLARKAGMTEVATNILHNVGNVLNSVNVSAELIQNCFSNSKIYGIIQVSDLIADYKHNFS